MIAEHDRDGVGDSRELVEVEVAAVSGQLSSHGERQSLEAVEIQMRLVVADGGGRAQRSTILRARAASSRRIAPVFFRSAGSSIDEAIGVSFRIGRGMRLRAGRILCSPKAGNVARACHTGPRLSIGVAILATVRRGAHDDFSATGQTLNA